MTVTSLQRQWNTLTLLCIAITLIILLTVLRSSTDQSSSSTLFLTTSPICPDRNDKTTAYHESLHFFDDVDAYTWQLLKDKVRDMGGNTNGDPTTGPRETRVFYQNHYEPNFVCPLAQRMGGFDEGGKWVCDPHRIKKQTKCLIYSVGAPSDLNYDFAFESSLLTDIGSHCDVHVFGYGGISLGDESSIPGGITAHPWTIGDERGVRGRNADETTMTVRTLAQTVRDLGHGGRTIDILKIDCDGCEYRDYQSWFTASLSPPSPSPVMVRQILVELHHGEFLNRQAVSRFFKTLVREGYVIFQKEPIFERWEGNVQDLEYGFIKLNKTFF